MNALAALTFLAFSPAAQAAAPPPPIVNGTPTDLYPEVVVLRFADADWANVFICSGVVVAEQWVLTSAHCVTEVSGYDLTEMTAWSGATWEAGVAEVPADDWFAHPDYYVSDDASVIEADLGLVHLSAPLAGVSPATRNTADLDEAIVGQTLRWVGWGATDDYSYDAGYAKRYADMDVIGLEDEYLLAFDEGGAATCGGDSGGAVLRIDGATATLLAIHTFGRDDDGTLCDGSTSGDVRIDLYNDWVDENITPSSGDGGGGDGGGDGSGDSAAPVEDDGSSPTKEGCAHTPGRPLLALTGLALALGLGRRRR